MRKVIRRRIRHREDGLDLAVDFNADVAINVGRSDADQVADATDAEDPAQPDGNDDERKEP